MALSLKTVSLRFPLLPGDGSQESAGARCLPAVAWRWKSGAAWRVNSRLYKTLSAYADVREFCIVADLSLIADLCIGAGR
jgi:hypothetical protein